MRGGVYISVGDTMERKVAHISQYSSKQTCSNYTKDTKVLMDNGRSTNMAIALSAA